MEEDEEDKKDEEEAVVGRKKKGNVKGRRERGKVHPHISCDKWIVAAGCLIALYCSLVTLRTALQRGTSERLRW